MAYPTDDQINQWASTNAADPEPVFAFADVKGRLPNDPNEMRGWISATLANAAFVGITDSMLIYAYIIDNRGLPPNSATFMTWLAANGYYANNAPTGLEPQVGQGYDAAVGLTTVAPPSSTTVPIMPGPTSAVDGVVSAVQANPIIYIGGAAVGVYLIAKLLGGGRR